MIRKKNKFFTFVFSLLPGAGEMYMGFMKMGVSLMSLFFLTLMMSNFLALDFMFYVAVIIWFYGFFHTNNLAGMPDEQFAQMQDVYLIPFAGKEDGIRLTKTWRKGIAILLIVVGVFLLWRTMWSVLSGLIPPAIYVMIVDINNYYLPRGLIGVAIIILGIYMIRGKQKQLEAEEMSPEQMHTNELHTGETAGKES